MGHCGHSKKNATMTKESEINLKLRFYGRSRNVSSKKITRYINELKNEFNKCNLNWTHQY